MQRYSSRQDYEYCHHSVADSMMPGFLEDIATPLWKSVFLSGV